MGVTVASSLAVGAPVYLKTLNRLSLDTAFDRASNHFLRMRTYVPFVPLQEASLDNTDAAFHNILESNLSDISGDVVRHLRTDALFLGTPVSPLPISRPPPESPRGYFQVLSGIESRIAVVEGRTASDRIEDGPGGPMLEGVVAARLAQFYRLAVGDVVVLARSIDQPERIHARVTGFIEPIDAADPYWPLGANLFRVGPRSDDAAYQIDRAAGPDAEAAQLLEDAEAQTQLGIFVSQDTLLQAVGQVLPSTFSTIDYYVGANRDALKNQDLEDTRGYITGFEGDLADYLPGASAFTGITDVLDAFEERSFFSSIPLLLLLAVMLLAVLYYLYMMVTYLVEARANDVASLRTRGTSLWHLFRVYSVEGLVLVAIPAVVAPFLVMGVVTIAGRLPYFDEFTAGGLLPVELTLTPFLVAWGAAALCLVMFVVPGVFGGRVALIAQKLRLARPPSLPLFQRYYLDVALMALGGLLFWEMQARGQLASGGLFDDVQVNEALLAAPVLLLAVVALLFMRFFPLLVRFIGGESPAFVHIWTSATLLSLAAIVMVREIRVEYNLAWLPQAAALAAFAAAYTAANAARRWPIRLPATGIEAALAGLFIWMERPSPDDLTFVPVILLAIVVPMQMAYWGFRSLAKAAPIGVSMTLLRMARNPLQYTWMMLLLVMLTGLGVLSTTVGATLGVSQEEQVFYDLAADIHVTRVAPPVQMGHREYKAHLTAIPEIEDAALAHRTLGEIGETVSRSLFPFLAIESEPFAEIAWFRDDFSDRPLTGLMTSLRTSIAPIPMTIPEEAVGVGVWVRPERPYPAIFVMMSLEDSNGIIETLNLGAIAQEEWQIMSTGLPQEMQPPINILSFQIFEFVHGPSGTPGSVMIDNLFAAMPDGDPIVIEDFEGQIDWSPFKVSLSSSDSVAYAAHTPETIFPGQQAPGRQALLYRFSKDTDFGMRGIHRLSEDGRIPVIVNDLFADSTGVRVGDSFVVTITSRRFPVIVRHIVDYFPTLAPEGVGFMIGEMDTFLRYINMIGPGLRFTPNEIFASTVPDGQDRAISGIQRMDITLDQIESAEQRLAAARVDPLVIAGWKLMVLISVGLIVLLSGIGYAVYLLMFTTRSRSEMGTLQTIGLTRGQLIGLLGFEHVAIVLIGLALGSWAGFQMSRIMISTLAVTDTGDPVLPPFVLDTQWTFMAPCLCRPRGTDSPSAARCLSDGKPDETERSIENGGLTGGSWTRGPCPNPRPAPRIHAHEHPLPSQTAPADMAARRAPQSRPLAPARSRSRRRSARHLNDGWHSHILRRPQGPCSPIHPGRPARIGRQRHTGYRERSHDARTVPVGLLDTGQPDETARGMDSKQGNTRRQIGDVRPNYPRRARQPGVPLGQRRACELRIYHRPGDRRCHSTGGQNAAGHATERPRRTPRPRGPGARGPGRDIRLHHRRPRHRSSRRRELDPPCRGNYQRAVRPGRRCPRDAGPGRESAASRDQGQLPPLAALPP